MTTPTIGRLLNKLERVKAKQGGGWVARCPAHDDHNPSLSIDVKEGKVLLTCFVGCAYEAILSAVGLTSDDLHRSEHPLPFRQPVGKTPPVAVYQYRNHDGKPVAEKARFELPDGKKSFRWRALGDAGWSGIELAGLSLTDLALWGSEALADHPGETVYFCEGEKAAGACHAAGLLAVTFAGGASTKNFGAALDVLAGRRVALWPDNDPAGREYMALVESRLRGVAAELRLITVPLPPKGDAWDYFHDGGTVADLPTGAPLTGPAVEMLADDAVRVIVPTPVGVISFTLTEIEQSRRAMDAQLSIQVEAVGYAREPYTERVNLLSQSGIEALRRNLDTLYGKDLGWIRLLNTALGTARTAYLSHDRSMDIYDIESTADDLFFVDPLLPANAMTILFGDGGSLKSYAAFALAFAVATGSEYLGYTPPAGHVIVLDYEDNAQNFRRRMHRIALGMGFDGFSPGLIRYYPARGIPLRDLVDSLAQLIREHGTTLLIVDSIGPACGGKPEEAEVALAYVRAVAKLKVTSLHLAHISKDDVRRGHTQYPFGSVYFSNEARRTWYIHREQEEESDHIELALFCRKVNDGQRPRPLGLKAHFEGLHGAVQLSSQEIGSLPSLAKLRTPKVRIREALHERNSATIKELAELLSLSTDAIESVLKDTATFVKVGTRPVPGGGKPSNLWGLFVDRAVPEQFR